MRARRTVKERDIVKILVFGYDRTLIKSIKDSGFRSMSDVISYANNMVGDKPIDHIMVSNEARGWCGSYTNSGDYYPHRSHMYDFGKRVKDIDSLPKKVIEFIKYITR